MSKPLQSTIASVIGNPNKVKLERKAVFESVVEIITQAKLRMLKQNTGGELR